jgi:hypothetical protein
MKYKAIIPFIPDMGSISPIICSSSPSETKEENLLWYLNSMREHDNLRARKSIPKGVKFIEIED